MAGNFKTMAHGYWINRQLVESHTQVADSILEQMRKVCGHALVVQHRRNDSVHQSEWWYRAVCCDCGQVWNMHRHGTEFTLSVEPTWVSLDEWEEVLKRVPKLSKDA